MALSNSRTLPLPLRYENIADETDPRNLSLISMVEACTRVGHLFDCWQRCPGQIRKFFSDEFNGDKHALRGLFLPEPDVPPPARTHPHEATMTCYNVGDTVKTRLPEAIREKYQFTVAPFKDAGREWHRATISDIAGDSKFQIKWEDGYTDASGADLFEVDAQDLIRAEDGTRSEDGTPYRNGVDVFLRKEKKRLQKIALRTLFFFAVMAIPEPLMMHGQPLCERIIGKAESVICTSGELQAHPQLHAFVNNHFGFCISWSSLALILITKFCLAPLYLLLLRLWSLCLERCAKREAMIVCFDYIFLGLLPQVYYKTEVLCTILYLQIHLSGAIIAGVTQTPGILPFAHMIAKVTMQLANAAFGEDCGLQELRKEWLLSVLEKQLEKSDIDLTTHMLRMELDRFLKTPPNAHVITIGLPFLTLLAATIHVNAPESTRLRYFIVLGAYAEFSHEPEKMADMKFRRDVNVDVFAETCTVPGVNLKGERWQEQGTLLPWHLAVNFAQVRAHELRLRELGMPAGHGCFTWRSTNNKIGVWAAREALDIERKIAKGKQLAAEYKALDEEFNALALQDDLNVDMLRAFLRAGANPDYVPNHVKESGLSRASRKATISPELLEMLMQSPKFETNLSLQKRSTNVSGAATSEAED